MVLVARQADLSHRDQDQSVAKGERLPSLGGAQGFAIPSNKAEPVASALNARASTHGSSVALSFGSR